MGLGKGRHAATDIDNPSLVNWRRNHLSSLDEEVRRRPGLACGIVERQGVPVLNVLKYGAAGHVLVIACDFVDGEWRYVWADTGETIGTVNDTAEAARAIVQALEKVGRR